MSDLTSALASRGEPNTALFRQRAAVQYGRYAFDAALEDYRAALTVRDMQPIEEADVYVTRSPERAFAASSTDPTRVPCKACATPALYVQVLSHGRGVCEQRPL